MPNRFPTEAANAPVLGEDPDDPQAAGREGGVGGDGTPRGNPDGTPSRGSGRKSGGGEARPGKDINQAGFLKDKDKDRP